MNATTHQPKHRSSAPLTGRQQVREQRARLAIKHGQAVPILFGRHRAYDAWPGALLVPGVETRVAA